jgi:hypothetical protein
MCVVEPEASKYNYWMLYCQYMLHNAHFVSAEIIFISQIYVCWEKKKDQPFLALITKCIFTVLSFS